MRKGEIVSIPPPSGAELPAPGARRFPIDSPPARCDHRRTPRSLRLRLRLLALATLTGACARAPEVYADASGHTPGMGDTNGDGRVDLSDGLVVLRHQLSGGSRAVCAGVADINQDHRQDLGDAFAIWYHLYAGNTVFHDVEAGWCDRWDTLADPPAGRLALGWDAPKRSEGEDLLATVELQSPDLAVEGWSLAVVAEGCEISAATTQGTVGADLRDDPPGIRDGGFDRTEVVGGVASSAVVLGWLSPVALDPSEDAVALLRVTISAPPPASGCQPCTLRLDDDRVTGGEPVVNLLSVGGRSYRPALPEATVKVCAP